MVTKSILKLAMADEKGVDFSKIKEKNRLKNLRREKRKKAEQKKPIEEQEGEGWEDEEDEDEDEDEDEEGEEVSGMFDVEALDDSDTSDSEVEMEEKIIRPKKARVEMAAKATKADKSAKAAKTAKPAAAEDDEDEDDDEDEEEEDDIPVSDLEDLSDEDKEDLIPHTRLTINNTAALLSALNRIRIPTDSSAPFATHQSVVSETATADAVANVSDDLNRELQFYKQSRDAVLKARALLRKEGVPFSRPTDVSYPATPRKPPFHPTPEKGCAMQFINAKHDF